MFVLVVLFVWFVRLFLFICCCLFVFVCFWRKKNKKLIRWKLYRIKLNCFQVTIDSGNSTSLLSLSVKPSKFVNWPTKNEKMSFLQSFWKLKTKATNQSTVIVSIYLKLHREVASESSVITDIAKHFRFATQMQLHAIERH